jgi:phosphoesterase RecJ-like protein
MDKRTSLVQILNTILSLEGPIYILSHPSPDGDSVGSTMGLYHLLGARGIKAVPVLADPPPTYSFLTAGAEVLKPPVDIKGKNIIVLDCSDVKRLHQTGQSLDGAKLVINIDHHLNNDMFGHENYVDPTVAAVGQILHTMFYGTGPYPQQAAQALFAALFTDTGRFSYGNTNAAVLGVGAELVELGANPQNVYDSIYQNKSSNYYGFLSEALKRISLSSDNRVAIIGLERKLLAEHKLEDWELDDLNEYPRSLKGVRVSAILKETDEGIKVSLRSKGDLNVATVARDFGGGGHKNAAGASIEMDLNQAIEQLKKRLEQEFEH